MPAKGVLVSHSFPSQAIVGKTYQWSFKVINQGDVGAVGGAINNDSGNPDSIIIEWRGERVEVPPGKAYIIYAVNAQPGAIIETSGNVIFRTPGTYSITIAGVHLEAGIWLIDTKASYTTKVSKETPTAPTIQIPTLLLIGVPVAVGAIALGVALGRRR